MRRLASVTTIVALAFLTGCDLGSSQVPAQIDWASIRKADISCLGDVDVVHEDHYDLNGDGRAEVFLIMRCKSRQDPQGDQLELIAGGADPDTARPTKLFLQMPDPAVIDKLCFANKAATYRVTIAGKSKVEQVKWPKKEAKPGSPTPVRGRSCP